MPIERVESKFGETSEAIFRSCIVFGWSAVSLAPTGRCEFELRVVPARALELASLNDSLTHQHDLSEPSRPTCSYCYLDQWSRQVQPVQ